jgi:hypothetical protein
LKTFRADSAGLRVDVEVGVGWASDTSFSVPDRLVLGAGVSAEWCAGGVIADAFQLGGIEGVSGRAADALALALVPVRELGAALTGEGVGVPVVGSIAGNANLPGVEVGPIGRAEATAAAEVIGEAGGASEAL